MAAKEDDCARLIENENAAIYDSDNPDAETPVILLARIPPAEINQALLKWAKSIKYETGPRTRGLISTSRIFGYVPRNPRRGANYCHVTSLAEENPGAHAAAMFFGRRLARLYQKWCPRMYEKHRNLSEEKIHDTWRIKETPYTSGIINSDNPLAYHYDAGNFQDVYSNMVCITGNITGGNLSIPYYDIRLRIRNGSVVIFNGQKLLHGVTPIIKTHPRGYRYTIVYYTLKQMWNCLATPREEVEHGRTVQDTRIKHKIQRLKGEIPNEIN